MSAVNRPITVKDLRQQFQQQTSFTTNNPSEEYIYNQRQTKSSKTRSSRSNENKNWTNESMVTSIATPRSFDTFGISSDDDDNNDDESNEDEKPNVKKAKADTEKTLVKRRYDSEYTSPNNTTTSIEQDDSDDYKPSKQLTSRKSQPSSSTERVS